MHGNNNKRPKILINDNEDILIEILTRLDPRSLSAATCVCRLWRSVLTDDLLWEHLCFRNACPLSQRVRPLVAALGGYRRLYTVCVRPILTRLERARTALPGTRWTRLEVEMSLSLFCVEYYERLGGGGGNHGGRSSSLVFLRKPVNV